MVNLPWTHLICAGPSLTDLTILCACGEDASRRLHPPGLRDPHLDTPSDLPVSPLSACRHRARVAIALDVSYLVAGTVPDFTMFRPRSSGLLSVATSTHDSIARARDTHVVSGYREAAGIDEARASRQERFMVRCVQRDHLVGRTVGIYNRARDLYGRSCRRVSALTPSGYPYIYMSSERLAQHRTCA